MVIFGAFELWPPKQKLVTPGVVTLRYLKPIMPSEYEELEHSELLEKVRFQMLKSMVSTPKPPTFSLSFLFTHFVALFAVFVLGGMVLRLFL